MTESVTMDQLKVSRTTAKRLFSRLANNITRLHTVMSEEELKDNFKKLTLEATKVMEINDDIGAQYVVDNESEELTEQQKTDLDKSATDCETKLSEIRNLIQQTLWANYGEEEFVTALQNAETEADRVSAIDPSEDKDAFGFLVEHLGLLVRAAKKLFVKWKCWAPKAEQQEFQGRIRVLEVMLPKLTARKADCIRAKVKEDADKGLQATRANILIPPPQIRLKPASLPKFTGIKREFHRWKRDWEALQIQGEPTGSQEIKKFQLLDSIDDNTSRVLRLSSYKTATDMFRVLENRFGNKTNIAIEIVEDLQKLPIIKDQQPRKIIELIQCVEKALSDLSDLGRTGAIKNPLVTKGIESKLPDGLKKEWLLHVAQTGDATDEEERFDSLLKFLQSQESIYEELEQLSGDSTRPKHEQRQARTKTAIQANPNSQLPGCVVCGDRGHRRKLYFCRKFRTLTLAERRDAMKKLGACKRCLEVHSDGGYCKSEFLCKNQGCKEGQMAAHHIYLCPNRTKITTVGGGNKSYTEAQEDFVRSLPPDLAERCRNVFSNTVARTSHISGQQSLLAEYGLKELPVVMMLLEVTANAGQKVGTLIDLASDTNYITHKAAESLNLRSEAIKLVVHGVGGMEVTVETKRYMLKVRIQTERGTFKSHQLVCYGLEHIADIHQPVSAKQLHAFFPDVPISDLRRPKEIQLLISHKEGRLAPQKVRCVGDLVLWDGPLGRTVAGTHPELFEKTAVSAHMSRTHFARSMRTAAVKYQEFKCTSPIIQHVYTSTATRDFFEWWKWESIGTGCNPKCGGCRCGNCQPGGKDMTLGEEREMEVVKGGLSYAGADEHSKSPHWHASYPWLEDPSTLPNNRRAVEATFFRTERQLAKDPQWKAAYTAQVHEMVNRHAAKKLSKETLLSWTGPVWYISHLIAPNPHSITTPVRLVWNSSQRYQGQSLNDILLKGPDVLNPIRGVLLKFRQGSFAALGDIRKMYNSVWLEEREVHLHRFLWRDSETEDLGEFAITRVNIGDKPAGCIAQLAMRETANLPQFSHLKEERQVLQEHSYVDDILTSHNDLQRLRTITANVERILEAGGFALKPWVFSGERKKDTEELSQKIIILPNQMKDEDSKALGLGYKVQDDKLHVMVRINFSKRKRKMRLGQNLLLEDVKAETPDPLTRRELLSQVAGLYDPIGLTAPTKQKGTILVRKAFQEAKPKMAAVKDTWDLALSDGLRESAIELFEDYIRLSKIMFTRSLTPLDTVAEPIAVTFSDGSESSYGALLYLRWTCKAATTVRLVEAKAKLTPFDQKGDPVKAELCGAVFASRLKKYFLQHSQIKVRKWYHFLDSQTILGAIHRESYGFQTFFANRIGEIQSSTNLEDWWWIPSSLNIADIITRGAGPDQLDDGSEWQQGPEFLSRQETEWPIKSAKDVAATARENINQIQKKSFVSVLTRAQVRKNTVDLTQQRPHRPPAGSAVKILVNEQRFSHSTRLVKTVALVWRAAKKFAGIKKTLKSQKWEAVSESGVVSVEERQDALRDIFLAAQEGVTFPTSTTNRLVVFTDSESGLLLCGGRIQSFNEDSTAVPLLPHGAWISTLLAREAHNESHEGVAATMLRIRRKAWVVRGRLIAKKVVENCLFCRKARAKRCQQIMASLPPERTRPAAPFEYTAVDLFGPYLVKDEVKKRVKMKVWGIIFSCMASRAIHTDLVNSMSTESFLMAYLRFTAVRGHPKRIWSDPGTNFIGAKPVLKELYQLLQSQNRSVLEETSAKNGTIWEWKIQPADSPHRNGAAEAAVRIIKKALQGLDGETNLTYSEFQTTLQQAANLANERPIDARVQSREDFVQYVTPNTLLLGRASPNGDVKTFDFESYPYKRLQEMQNVVNKFWRSWSQLAGPNLFVRHKWHTSQRNVAVGDIVWLCDQNAIRGQFKLGRVTKTHPDSKGIVRDVHLKVVSSAYTPVTKPAAGQTSNGFKGNTQTTTLHRDVRRLVILLPVEEQK